MNLSKFFIDRPIFAGVISIVIFLAGLISMFQLPISEYPEVVPPSVVVKAPVSRRQPQDHRRNRGHAAGRADQRRREHALHVLAGRQRRHADPHRHLQARHRPRHGAGSWCRTASTRRCRACRRSRAIWASPRSKARPTSPWWCICSRPTAAMTCCICAITPRCKSRTCWPRFPGVGSVQLFGSGDYAMRIWLNPDKIAERGLTADDVVNAIREQNVQVAAGVIGGPPYSDSGRVAAADQRRGPADPTRSNSARSSSRPAPTA